MKKLLIVSAYSKAEEMKLRLAENGFPQIDIVDYTNAISVIRACVPDLILLTKQSGLSSLLLISKIHRQFPLVPIVMVATDPSEEAMREHIEAGASDYIYYVGPQRELLPFVVQQNLDSRTNELLAEASEEARTRFKQLEHDQKSGFRVQQAMLPESPTSLQGISFNHQLYPSLIMSGDFIDYFELFDGRVAFYIADVSGHGASSAFITVLLKSLSRRLLDDFQRFMSTAEILAWINAELLQWHLEQHVTMFFGIIDQENHLLEYSNAAHFPGTILCHSGGAEFLEIGGQPLGLYAEPQYEPYQVALPDRYAIVMFSDGVFEILPQATLEAKEEHLLSVVELHKHQEDPIQLIDELVDDLGVLMASSIPDDIAVFTVASAGRPG
ncbi:MAG: SpoIIE family protein phosphatase [Pseudomonadales bacterium]|nr:SpoIIE family protein phosphatase [Pseudomonadales bacterium]MBO6566269.1 SpoIIE family protein phosphatase [Pseudomonadales bacterium]MBO6595681.1 SpoIIE family protein phosphatase [Pseudomonadales bacterium]MBO6702181.1 SpoIIE family protein phosphatase [Pseudomonadales bacterium]MBO6820761.1 SpoIIE family protein phosphatase [Pseudomonadales bacterium]